MSLSDMQCRTAKPKAKKYKLSDSEGLYLEVMPTGARYWRLKYRLHGKEKRFAIGVYPEVSLMDARKLKAEAKEKIRQGVDPVLTRMEQRQTAVIAASDTFQKIALEWHSKQLENWDSRYAQTIKHRLEKYAFPDLGNYPLHLLKPSVILSCLQKVEKTAPEMTRRIKSYCHQIFMYAIAMDKLESDPTQGLEHALKKYQKGHFASITVDELPKFLLDLNEHKARLTRQTFLAVKLMFLTFIRTRELIRMEWFEINFEDAIWSIPAERMKMKRPHLVPLSKQAIVILSELKEMNSSSKYVFPSIPRPKKHMSNGTILAALKRMGYSKRMTGHGFRSLAMGILKEKLGYLHDLVDRQLAHAHKSETDKAYDRALYLNQRIEMMQRYADYLDQVFINEISKNLSRAA